MKNLLLATSISVGIPLSAFAQTTTPMHEVAGVPLVEVSVNGAGPYLFVLDTGANVTMVKGPLLQALKIAPTQPVTIAGSLGESHQQRVSPGSLAVAGLGADNIEIDMLEEGQLGILEGHAQGILGENFLKHFDVLIDNDRHTLTLDRTNRLAQSLAGERLPLSVGGRSPAELTYDRLFVPLRAPSLVERSMLFLVDSGTNTAVVYPLKNETLLFSRGVASGSIHSLSRNQICRLARTPLTIGSQTYRQVVMAICENMTRDNIDSDGLLPTRLFRRLFISHRDKYVIANPQAASKGKDANIKLAETFPENVTSP
jgi:Aspartyl protease